MSPRAFLLALIAPLLVGSGLVFDAATRTAHAIEVAADAGAAPSNAVRAETLARAERALGPGLAFAGMWHAGAAEARSGLALMRGDVERDRAGLERSAHWARRAVAQSPVMPNAWARLAALEDSGVDARLCSVEECLELSWRTGPMLGGPTGCARLKIAHRHGWLAPGDARIEQYALSGASAAEVAECLQFLGPEVVYQALLRRRR